MSKITNKTVQEELKLPHSTYYDWQREFPRRVELIKKGLVAEKVLNKEIFDEMIKPDNKPRSK